MLRLVRNSCSYSIFRKKTHGEIQCSIQSEVYTPIVILNKNREEFTCSCKSEVPAPIVIPDKFNATLGRKWFCLILVGMKQ